MKTLISILTLGLTVPAWAQSWDVVITNSMTIVATNTTYDGHSVLINAATVTIAGAHSFNNLGLTNYAKLTHGTGDVTGVNLTVSNTLLVATNSSIDASGCGALQAGLHQRVGGSHGGRGGSFGATLSPATYGNYLQPTSFGGGALSAPGGGYVKIVADVLRLDGMILSDGVCLVANNGGSAGGSIWLDVGTLSGAGRIRANGGSALSYGSGGGGGRVAVYYTGAGEFDLTAGIHALGGNWNGQADGGYTAGGAGTIYLQNKGTGVDQVIVNNAGRVAAVATELGLAEPCHSLTIYNASVRITNDMTLTYLTTSNAVITQNGVLAADHWVLGTNIVWTQNVAMSFTDMPAGEGMVWVQNAALTLPDNRMTVSAGLTWIPVFSQTWASVVVTNGGKITHTLGNTNGVRLTVSGLLHVAPNSSIDVSGCGNVDAGVHSRVGGSHGGRGGRFDSSNLSRACFGDFQQPITLGGGSRNGRGGGPLRS